MISLLIFISGFVTGCLTSYFNKYFKKGVMRYGVYHWRH